MQYLPQMFTFITHKKNRLSLTLFSLLCFNVFLAQAVQAATGGELSRSISYAITLLGVVTLSLSIYLFVVIFQPEKF